ncbi:hypothetical protein ACU8OR_25465 (plasmid) [Rhizobium leguminosarum]
MTTPELLNLVGRIGVAIYFLWSVQFNIAARGHHYAEFQRIGLGGLGKLLFAAGIAISFLGSLLLLYTPTAWIGAALLIVFTFASDALFHRYWTYKDPGDMVVHKFFLIEHIALAGGILGLAAGTL